MDNPKASPRVTAGGGQATGEQYPMISDDTSGTLGSLMWKGKHTPAFENLPPIQEHASLEKVLDIASKYNGFEGCDVEQFYNADTSIFPCSADREGYYGGDDTMYWMSGLRHAHIASNTVTSADEGRRVLEMGCASGRVLRHFTNDPRYCEVWGADIKLRHVEWVRQNLRKDVKIVHNTILPSLPIEDNYLDLVVCYSVFTHIDDLELAWIAEIRRVLKPGGTAFITIHDENTWDMLNPDELLYKNLLKLNKQIEDWEVNEELLDGPMPHDRIIFKWPSIDVYNNVTFFSEDYVRDAWGRFFSKTEVYEGFPKMLQRCVVMTK